MKDDSSKIVFGDDLFKIIGASQNYIKDIQNNPALMGKV